MAIPAHRNQTSSRDSGRLGTRGSINNRDAGPPCPACQSSTTPRFQLSLRGRASRSFRCLECGRGAVTSIEITRELDRNPRLAASRRLLQYGIGVSGRRVGDLFGESAPMGSYRIYKPTHSLAIIEPVGIDVESIDSLCNYISSMAPDQGIPITIEVDRSRSWILVAEDEAIPVSTVFYHERGSTTIELDAGSDLVEPANPRDVSTIPPPSDLPDTLSVEGDVGLDELVTTVDEIDTTANRTKRAIDESMEVSLNKSGGKYIVRTKSGAYQVDLVSKGCNCDDWKFRQPDGGCKHLRRVLLELALRRIPRPDGRAALTQSME